MMSRRGGVGGWVGGEVVVVVVCVLDHLIHYFW